MDVQTKIAQLQAEWEQLELAFLYGAIDILRYDEIKRIYQNEIKRLKETMI